MPWLLMLFDFNFGLWQWDFKVFCSMPNKFIQIPDGAVCILGSVAKSFSRNFPAEASLDSTHQTRHPGPDMSNSSNIWSQVESLAMWKFRFSANIVLVAWLSRRTFLFKRFMGQENNQSFSIQAPKKYFLADLLEYCLNVSKFILKCTDLRQMDFCCLRLLQLGNLAQIHKAR